MQIIILLKCLLLHLIQTIDASLTSAANHETIKVAAEHGLYKAYLPTCWPA